MSNLFSTPAEHAFEHPELENINNGEGSSSTSTSGAAALAAASGILADGEFSVEDGFEVDDCVRRIREGGYKTVCCRLD
jgi:hypothetical protein